jgi:hypothetical protein
MKTNLHFLLTSSQNENVSEKLCTENQNTYFKFNTFIFLKVLPFIKLCKKKYCRGGNAADNNNMHVLCILDT